jgi:hypothetical protein
MLQTHNEQVYQEDASRVNDGARAARARRGGANQKSKIKRQKSKMKEQQDLPSASPIFAF